MHLGVAIGILVTGETSLPNADDVIAVVFRHTDLALFQVFRDSVRLAIHKGLIVRDKHHLVICDGRNVEFLGERDIGIRQFHRLLQQVAIDVDTTFTMVHPHIQVTDGTDGQAVTELRVRFVGQHLLRVGRHGLTIHFSHHPLASDLLGEVVDRRDCAVSIIATRRQ